MHPAQAAAALYVQCDYCPCVYHLDCLEPPLCAPPPRFERWMCPNHVEHVLDALLLRATDPKHAADAHALSRLSDRLRLWETYASASCVLHLNLDCVVC